MSSRRVARSTQHTSSEKGLHIGYRPQCYSECSPRTPSKREALRESPIVVKTCGAKHTTHQLGERSTYRLSSSVLLRETASTVLREGAARGVQFSSRRVVRSTQHTSLEQDLHTNNRPQRFSERLFQAVLRGGAARGVELSSRRVARSTQHTSCSHSASLLRYCAYCWERMIYGTMIYYTNSSLIFGNGCGFSHKARKNANETKSR